MYIACALTLIVKLKRLVYNKKDHHILIRSGSVLHPNGAAAFQAKAHTSHPAEQERIDHLRKKIQVKDEVLAELMAEHVALKKSLGEI